MSSPFCHRLSMYAHRIPCTPLRSGDGRSCSILGTTTVDREVRTRCTEAVRRFHTTSRALEGVVRIFGGLPSLPPHQRCCLSLPWYGCSLGWHPWPNRPPQVSNSHVFSPCHHNEGMESFPHFWRMRSTNCTTIRACQSPSTLVVSSDFVPVPFASLLQSGCLPYRWSMSSIFYNKISNKKPPLV